MEFSRQECWNGLPLPPSRDLPQGLNPRLLCHLLGRLIFTTEPPGKPLVWGEVKWGEVTQSCPTLCDPMDCSLPGFSVHGILQARILEWVTTSFSRGSSQPRNQTWVSHIGGRRFNLWATREALVWGEVTIYIFFLCTYLNKPIEFLKSTTISSHFTAVECLLHTKLTVQSINIFLSGFCFILFYWLFFLLFLH